MCVCATGGGGGRLWGFGVCSRGSPPRVNVILILVGFTGPRICVPTNAGRPTPPVRASGEQEILTRPEKKTRASTNYLHTGTREQSREGVRSESLPPVREVDATSEGSISTEMKKVDWGDHSRREQRCLVSGYLSSLRNNRTTEVTVQPMQSHEKNYARA